jgi:hypothetical protein
MAIVFTMAQNAHNGKISLWLSGIIIVFDAVKVK